MPDVDLARFSADPIICMVIGMVCLALIMVFEDDFDEAEARALVSRNNAFETMRAILSTSLETYRGYQKGRVDINGMPIPKRRRSVTGFNWERARACILADYLGPQPTFNDRTFERHFRITRSIFEEVSLVCGQMDRFFRETIEVAKRTRGIDPNAKILFALQMLANGTSPSAHQAYYQMGETTAREALKKLAWCIANSCALRGQFFRSMTRTDARNASDLHKRKHGVEGMIGSLDCMHIGWKNCPVAWQGAYTSGKEGHPTLVLEAMADHNLFFWHASFGWAGTLNDLNIWEGSDLYREFLDGTWSERVDFPFSINGQDFNKLYVLVDGIYPELARFVKPLMEPTLRHEKAYSRWQEASRKDIERTFGVYQRKFHIVVKRVELHFKENIKDIVMATIILHNMMVAYRISCNEEEREDWYEPVENADNIAVHSDPDRDTLDRRRANTDEHAALTNAFYTGLGTNYAAEAQAAADRELPYHYQLVQERWANLRSHDGFARLHDAITAEVVRNTQARAVANA
jgi:hypothetical protein